MVKTRCTQKVEMLFELKKDPTIKSLASRELVAKSLRGAVNVQALSQEAVVEVNELDEIRRRAEGRSDRAVQRQRTDGNSDREVL